RRMALVRAVILNRRAIDEQDVHPAIVVIVERRHAATLGFKDVEFFFTATGQVEIDACGASNVNEHILLTCWKSRWTSFHGGWLLQRRSLRRAKRLRAGKKERQDNSGQNDTERSHPH